MAKIIQIDEEDLKKIREYTESTKIEMDLEGYNSDDLDKVLSILDGYNIEPQIRKGDLKIIE